MSEQTLFDYAPTVKLKACRKCGEAKPESDFYPFAVLCKPCFRERVRDNRAAKREQYSAYEQRLTQTPERKRQMAESLRRRRQRQPEKIRARNIVASALRSGRIQRLPCQGCGATKNVQAHHSDYSKPLEVKWLCFKCHREREHGQVVVASPR